MIVYELKCSSGHVFEGWFRDGATFDRQAAAGKVSCAVCGDSQIDKAPMAPRLARGRGGDRDTARPSERAENGGEAAGDAVSRERAAAVQAEALRLLTKLREGVESACDYVGDKFAEEARRIHYGERKKRGIYGEASDEQARELADEGIEVKKIPWLPRRNA
jgi:hypothetical protein